MSDPTRSRINEAFDNELAAAPLPPGLRPLAVRAAISAPPRRSRTPLLALVAAILAVAIVATLVVGSHRLSSTPARPVGSVVPPAPRSGADIVYDKAHQELVLFGGSIVGGGVVNETWTWDGRVWRLEHPWQLPPARHDGVMAYDEARHDVVLFGGLAQLKAGKGGQSAVTDTWVWNGLSWSERHPLHEPAVGFDWPASMAFDPIGKTVLLYAFQRTTAGGLTNMEAQTWAWNGSDWARFALAANPTQFGVMVSDEKHAYLIASPTTRVAGRYLTEMWKWDGGAWISMARANNRVTGLGAMAYDPRRGKIVALVGPYTWTWDGSKWFREHPQTQPPSAGYMAYFAPRREVVTFGDRYGGGTNGMWAWTGTDWEQIGQGTIAPRPSPSGLFGTSPDAAAAILRQQVPSPTPVLLPTWLPAGMQATVYIAADGFNVTYFTDQFDKEITLGIEAANPPPGDSTSSDARVSFRGGQAEYFVYDAGAPLSDRWLMWSIGGSPKAGGTPYFMSASGLTDAEFWQVANSLQ